MDAYCIEMSAVPLRAESLLTSSLVLASLCASLLCGCRECLLLASDPLANSRQPEDEFMYSYVWCNYKFK